MIARKREIGLQLNQLIDALLLGDVFWICHLATVNVLANPASPAEIPKFAHFLWMLALIIPFAPFLLELNGFYNYYLAKSVQRPMSQDRAGGIPSPGRAGIRLFPCLQPPRTIPLFSQVPEQNKPIGG